MREFRLAIYFAVFIFGVTPAGWSWNKAAHMVTGAMAYYDLKNFGDTNTIARTIATLKRHPHYRSWTANLRSPTGGGIANHDLILFMSAATWPDSIRGVPRYDCGECHYINYPYRPPGTPETIQPPPPRTTNVVFAFSRNLARMHQRVPTRDKAIALCWIFHVVGDVHVPLHTTSLHTADFPDGDRGGNLFYIKPAPGPLAENLHAWWDNCVTEDEHWRCAKLRAIKMMSSEGMSRPDLEELETKKFRAWAKESHELAKSAVYLYGELPVAKTWLDAKILPPGYVANARKICQRRVTLAGYRLADVLREVYGSEAVGRGERAQLDRKR